MPGRNFPRWGPIQILLCALAVTGVAAPTAPERPRTAPSTLIGSISVEGKFDLPAPLPVFKNREFCGPWVPNETLLLGAGGQVQNAVVTLVPVAARVSTQPGTAVLDNVNCAFVPHVQVAAIGSELLLKNSDPILHAVHARWRNQTLFNVGLPTWRRVRTRLDRVGVVRIDCDVLHTWMSAVIMVVDTPYYAVSDSRGRFTVGNLPPGEYDMEVWHERLGSRRQRVRLISEEITRVDVVFSTKGRP